MYLNCDLEMFYHQCSTLTTCEISSTQKEEIMHEEEILYVQLVMLTNTQNISTYEESWKVYEVVIISYNNVEKPCKTFQKERCQHSVNQTDYG